MRPPFCRAEAPSDGGLDAGRRETAGDSISGPKEGADGIQFSDSDDSLLPDSLVRILSDPGVLLVGVGIGGDVSRLEKEYPQLRQRGVEGVVCLSEMAKRKVSRFRDLHYLLLWHAFSTNIEPGDLLYTPSMGKRSLVFKSRIAHNTETDTQNE